MRAASFAYNFRANKAMGKVFFKFNVFQVNRLVKTGPAGAGIKFGVRRKQRRAAGRASVRAFVCGVHVLAGKWRFRTFFPHNAVLFGGELLFKVFFCHTDSIAKKLAGGLTRKPPAKKELLPAFFPVLKPFPFRGAHVRFGVIVRRHFHHLNLDAAGPAGDSRQSPETRANSNGAFGLAGVKLARKEQGRDNQPDSNANEHGPDQPLWRIDT